MKFVIVVVLFAVALGAYASVVPISLTHGPVVVGGILPPAVVAVHTVPAAPIHVVTNHVVAEPAVVVAPHAATYVAKTLGAVHVAPLEGHVNSASSVNLEPAPGTA